MRGAHHVSAIYTTSARIRLFPSPKGPPFQPAPPSFLPRRMRSGHGKPGSQQPGLAKEMQACHPPTLLPPAMGGMLQPVSPPSSPPAPPALSLLRQYLGIEEKTNGIFSSATSLDPVFVCIDVEAFELDQSKITEFGIATFDSRELTGIAPSSLSELLCKIETRHFIIDENKRFVNKRHVKGCPDKFQFGSSHIVPSSKMKSILKQTFIMKDTSAPNSDKQRCRNIIFVGHELGGDINYMRKFGFRLDDRPEVIGRLDSRVIAGAMGLPENLEKLQFALGGKPEYLHNAGNDARYTLESAFLMALYGCALPEPPTMEKARQLMLKIKAERKIKEEEHNRLQLELSEKLKKIAKKLQGTEKQNYERPQESTDGKVKKDAKVSKSKASKPKTVKPTEEVMRAKARTKRRRSATKKERQAERLD